jgi:1-acyl-sn-glycerol-3-phosphate acyltransferase
MLNALVVLSILVLFAWYDALLAATRLLRPGSAFEAVESLSRHAVGWIFKILANYSAVRLDYGNLSGRELPERFLLVANHQSLLDIPVSMAVFRERSLRFVAKRELGGGIPFVSQLLRRQGHALIGRRGDATQAMRSISRFARRCAREGTSPVIFPEGTRSRDGFVGVFHTAGVRKILGESALPIVIAVLDGSWRVATMGGIMRNLRNAVFKVRVLSITAEVGSKGEVLAALEEARQLITRGLERLRAEDPASAPRPKIKKEGHHSTAPAKNR